MNFRERTEKMEVETLSEYAVKSLDSKGRIYPDEICTIRTSFQRDRDRIIHSKSFRRLKHKTQVFIAPRKDHYRTRLTHTLEVSQIARTIGRALRLNEDLVEAIALGHDLGHTPFGHWGEAVLNEMHPKGFKHNLQSVRVVEFLEHHKDDYPGLNLTYEVREGIAHHSGSDRSETLEGSVIKFADRIAYINHDIDDAIRANILKLSDIPKGLLAILGYTHGERINTMIKDLIENSEGQNKIQMSNEIGEAMKSLRDFMFEKVYFNKKVKSEDQKIERLLQDLYDYYSRDLSRLPKDHLQLYRHFNASDDDIICDYIAGMTDFYAISIWKDLFVPKSWNLG